MKKIITPIILLMLSSCTTTIDQIESNHQKYTTPEEYLQKEVGLTPYETGPLEFFFTGDAFYDELEREIQKAQDYILINSFLVLDDPCSRNIQKMLAKRMNEGVRVYLTSDSGTFYVFPQSGLPHAESLNIPVTEYNPIRAYRIHQLWSFFYRDHRKFWIFDGKSVYFGGQNLSTNSLASIHENGNVDTMIKVTSPRLIEELVTSYVRNWNNYNGKKIRVSQFSVPMNPETDRDIWIFNQENTSIIQDLFNFFYIYAENELWVIQAYAFTNPDMIKKVKYLTSKGVDVNIILSQRQEQMKFHYASFYGIQDLLAAGAKVYVWEYPMVDGEAQSLIHYKAMFMDNKYYTTGSANWNFRSEHLSKELNLIYTDQDAIEKTNEHLKWILDGCRKVTPEEASQYRSFPYFMYNFSLQIGG